jgi:predicted kinase
MSKEKTMTKPKCIILVGPPGSGKSTKAKELCEFNDAIYINQDSQGRNEHFEIFKHALNFNQSVVIDRMNFNREQRARYLDLAKASGYETEIIVLHESYDTCLARCLARKGHETITNEDHARGALQTFFTKYERPTKDEADTVTFIYPEGPKQRVIYSDLDGTLCNIEHRRHWVHPPPGQKKNWPAFFNGINDDTVNEPVMHTIWNFYDNGSNSLPIVYCSGRSEMYRDVSLEWLNKHNAPPGPLYMRPNKDSRQDFIVKEILLDFELKTRYEIFLALDDRTQVVNMLRNRGITVFQVAPGDF